MAIRAKEKKTSLCSQDKTITPIRSNWTSRPFSQEIAHRMEIKLCWITFSKHRTTRRTVLIIQTLQEISQARTWWRISQMSEREQIDISSKISIQWPPWTGSGAILRILECNQVEVALISTKIKSILITWPLTNSAKKKWYRDQNKFQIICKVLCCKWTDRHKITSSPLSKEPKAWSTSKWTLKASKNCNTSSKTMYQRWCFSKIWMICQLCQIRSKWNFNMGQILIRCIRTTTNWLEWSSQRRKTL